MNDTVLIQRLRAGDATAWDELVAATGDRLFRAACLLCHHDHNAQEAVQETFLRFARSMPRFRGDCAIYTWLHGILHNIVREQRHDTTRLVLTDVPPEGADIEADAGRSMDAADISNALQAALRRLTPEHREVMILRYYDRLKVEEIASRLGVSAGTVKSRLFHARQQMSVLVPESLNPFAT